jgi:hypothetical protein
MLVRNIKFTVSYWISQFIKTTTLGFWKTSTQVLYCRILKDFLSLLRFCLVKLGIMQIFAKIPLLYMNSAGALVILGAI